MLGQVQINCTRIKFSSIFFTKKSTSLMVASSIECFDVTVIDVYCWVVCGIFIGRQKPIIKFCDRFVLEMVDLMDNGLE